MEVFKIKSKDLVEKIDKFLKEGKVLIFPTDTVYGLLGDASSREVVKKVLKIKKRKKDKSIPIFVPDFKTAKKLAEISTKQAKFLKKTWPGKTTVILKRKNNLPKILFSEEKTIGLRIPNYPLLNKVLKRTKLPLTGTSANISGIPASAKLKKVLSQFENKKFQPDIIIDAGNLKSSQASTVVDISEKKLSVIREGQTSKEKLQDLYRSL